MALKTKTIRLNEIEDLGRLGATLEEAADSLGISVKSLRRLMNNDKRVQEAWDRGRATVKLSLRRKQLRLASSNASMAIWLGRQMLGQKEVVTNEISGPNGGPIETEVDISKLTHEERKQFREYLRKTQGE